MQAHSWVASVRNISLPLGKKREFRFHPIKETVVEEPVDITPYLDQLDESLRDKVLQLQKGRWVQLKVQHHFPPHRHSVGACLAQALEGQWSCSWGSATLFPSFCPTGRNK